MTKSKKPAARSTIPVHVDRELHKEAKKFAERMGITVGEAVAHLVTTGIKRLAALAKHSDAKKGERKGLTHRPTERKERREKLQAERMQRLRERQEAGIGKRRPPKSKVDEVERPEPRSGSDASLADAELE